MSLFKPEILHEFTKTRASLDLAASAIERDLRALIDQAGIRFYSFYRRTKSVDSLLQKVSRPDRTYNNLWDMTDLIGIRIVTAFEDSIEEFAHLIEGNFAVDLAHSQNRLQYDDHERFGYRSLHYVCKLPTKIESAQFPAEARFEIQVRTALQDVWAEIEHDLGYKASDLAPSQLRRRFSRISSLLEIADEELVNVKAELKLYLDGQRDQSRLDLVSLQDLLSHDVVEQMDTKIAKLLGVPISKSLFFPDYLLRALRLVDVTTVQSALSAMTEYKNEIAEFVPTYFKFAQSAWGIEKSSITKVERGYSLLFMAHVQLLEAEPLAVNRAKRFVDFYGKLDYPDNPKKAREVAEKLIETVARGG